MLLKLKQLLTQILKNPFLTGSIVMVVGSNFYNLGQFAYHFLAGRFLGKIIYGDLAVTISILGIIGIVQGALGMTVIKFIASEKSEKELSNFIKWVYFWAIRVGIVTAILVLLISPSLINFLNITQPESFYLLSPILFFYIMATAGRSVLQGLLKFNQYIFSLVAESVVKIPLTIIFALLGWAAFGAMGGLLLGIVSSFFIARLSLSDHLVEEKKKRPEIGPLLKFSSAVFVQGLALTSMYSTDLVLVKHFFPSDQAGIFASLNVLGRIVFFGASPITHVMFPLIAKKYARGEKYNHIFYLSLILVGIISAFIIFLFYFFPKVIISMLYGSSYIEGFSLLWPFAVFMTLLSFAMLTTQYFLSIGKTVVVWIFALAAILQMLLIWFIHPNLSMVIYISITVAALLGVSLFIYFLYYQFHGKDKK